MRSARCGTLRGSQPLGFSWTLRLFRTCISVFTSNKKGKRVRNECTRTPTSKAFSSGRPNALRERRIMKKDDRRLRLALLGCGPISQAAHLDAIRKARNADLYAICDIAEDLTGRLAAIYHPETVYNDFGVMLADPRVEAVVIAVADQFHVPLCRQALAAGKPVLVEKPLGTTVEECEDLRDLATETGLVFQVGNNRRFEPGMTQAHHFIREELGDL